MIKVETDIDSFTNELYNANSLVDGIKFQTFAPHGIDILNKYVLFDFKIAKVIIDEFTFYQAAGRNRGTWIFQGSNNKIDWNNVSESFLLGTTNTTDNSPKKYTINTKGIGYRYYRILGAKSFVINGGNNAGWEEFEFSINNILYNKYLIRQNNKYYSIKDNIITELGIPTDDIQKEQWFNDYGANDLKVVLLTPDENGEKLIDSLDEQFEVRMMVPKG